VCVCVCGVCVCVCVCVTLNAGNKVYSTFYIIVLIYEKYTSFFYKILIPKKNS